MGYRRSGDLPMTAMTRATSALPRSRSGLRRPGQASTDHHQPAGERARARGWPDRDHRQAAGPLRRRDDRRARSWVRGVADRRPAPVRSFRAAVVPIAIVDRPRPIDRSRYRSGDGRRPGVHPNFGRLVLLIDAAQRTRAPPEPHCLDVRGEPCPSRGERDRAPTSPTTGARELHQRANAGRDARDDLTAAG